MYITNCKIITPNGVLNNHTLKIENGLIKEIKPTENYDLEDKIVIDGEDHYLSPGFIDIHNHGNSGYDFMDATEEAIDAISKNHLENGVTSYLGTVLTSPMDELIYATEFLSNYKNKDNQAKALGVHVEGPHFDLQKKGAQNEDFIRKPSVEDVNTFLNISNQKIKMVSIAPELPNSKESIKAWLDAGVKVAIAHTSGTYEDILESFDQGATIATHLFNGMSSFSHREPGAAGASLVDDRVYTEIIYDRVHLHDGAVKLALKAKGYDKIVLVSDAMRAAGLEDGEFELGGQKVFVKDGAARLKSGSLAGSTLNLRKAVYNIVTHLQIPIEKAVHMASLSPARAIGLDEEIGSIEIGKSADLLIFDNKINIKKRFLNGDLVNL